MSRLFLLVIFIGTISSNASAQTWEAGVSVGGSGYMGDINPVRPYQITNPAFGGLLKRNFDGNWSLKLNLMKGKIQADDADSPNEYQKERNLNFYTPISEVSFQVEFNFFKYMPGMMPGYGNHRVSPYLFTGFGGVVFDPKTVYNDEEIKLQPRQTENKDYEKYGLIVPFGAGIKYNVQGNWNIIGELGYRTVFNDYLDDVSGIYPGAGNFVIPEGEALSDRSSTRIGAANTQRGDFRKRDTYMFAGFSLTYTFFSQKCPFQ